MDCPNCGSDDVVQRDGPAGLAMLECVSCESHGLSEAGVVSWNGPKAQRAYDAALRDERDVFDDWKREA